MIEKERLLNVRQASEILGIKPATLYMWRWRRLHLTFVKIGKALRISEKELIDFIEKRKKHPNRQS